jgi:hypothetical protein
MKPEELNAIAHGTKGQRARHVRSRGNFATTTLSGRHSRGKASFLFVDHRWRLLMRSD